MPLLLVALDHAGRPCRGCLRIEAGLAQRRSLAKQIPALVSATLSSSSACARLRRSLPPTRVATARALPHELLDRLMDLGIVHESSSASDCPGTQVSVGDRVRLSTGCQTGPATAPRSGGAAGPDDGPEPLTSRPSSASIFPISQYPVVVGDRNSAAAPSNCGEERRCRRAANDIQDHQLPSARMGYGFPLCEPVRGSAHIRAA